MRVKENCLLSNSLIKTTVHKPYFWKRFESKYSLLDSFVHFSTFRLTLSNLVLSVQHSHCLKIQCSEPFLLFTPGSLPSPYLSPLKSGLVALSAEISQHGVQSAQVHFHRSLPLCFSIRRHIRSKRWKDAAFQLGFHLAKHFTPTYDVKNADNNFLRSGRDNNKRRGTLLVSGVYLNNFPFIICLTRGPLYVMDIHLLERMVTSDREAERKATVEMYLY